MQSFTAHYGYSRTFQENKLTLGLIHPLETYQGDIPNMDIEHQMNLAKLAEESGFAALFVRDIPLREPAFGDVGQIYDPWIFLSYLAAHTETIALGTASVITSFRHPLHLAKSAASLDKLSKERLLFGLATGDREIEFDVFGVDHGKRATLYQEAFHVMKKTWATTFPYIQTNRITLTGKTDILPKPTLGDIPTLVTGFSGQSLEWIATHSDGWMSYPRNPILQQKFIDDYRALAKTFKPFAQSLHVDLSENPHEEPTYMHLGFRSGHKFLIEYVNQLREIGVNHVIISNKEAKRPADEIIQELAEEVVPHFPVLK